MIRTNIYLPERMLLALKVLSDESGISVAELVRRALEDYLRKQK